VEIHLHALITLALGREERSVSQSGLFKSEDTAPLLTEWELSVFQSGSGNSGEYYYYYCSTTITDTTNVIIIIILIIMT